MKVPRHLQTTHHPLSCSPDHCLHLKHRSTSHPAEIALSEGHIFAFSERVIVQDVVIIQQQQLGGVLAMALLPTPPQATKGPAPPYRDTHD